MRSANKNQAAMPWKATDAMKEGEWPSRMQEGNWRPVLTLLEADTRSLLRAEPMLENLLEQRRVIAVAHRARGWLSPGGQPCLLLVGIGLLAAAPGLVYYLFLRT